MKTITKSAATRESMEQVPAFRAPAGLLETARWLWPERGQLSESLREALRLRVEDELRTRGVLE